MSPAIAVEDLAVGYCLKGKPDACVASGLSFQLQLGEFICLLGPNGTGKSTLIRTLAGMQSPLRGSIRISGTDLLSMNAKQRARGISVVLTESVPSGLFDVYSLVALGRHPHTGWSGKLSQRDREQIEAALRAVGGEALSGRQVSELSDGERQKVMIARALAQEARVVLLDEPTAFLDLPRRVELMRTLRDLARRENLCILLSTHDLDLALGSADRLLLLGEGGEFSEGIPESLALDGSVAKTFVSESVEWDDGHGAFRLNRSSRSRVAVSGEGAAALWSRRALARIGFEVVAAETSADLSVAIDEREGRTHWRVAVGSVVRTHDSLSAMVEHMRATFSKENNF